MNTINSSIKMTDGRRCPVRDKISVERRISPMRSRRPFRDGMVVEKYCVPNGTLGLACASVFYQYCIPNGMPRSALYIVSTVRCIPDGMPCIFDSVIEKKPSFSPHLTNITTSVAPMSNAQAQPHYLINTGKNEVMRSIMGGYQFSTAVVLFLKLGRNEVINVAFNKPLFSTSALNRITNKSLLSPYSLILANKGIRVDEKGDNFAMKGAFQNKGLTQIVQMSILFCPRS